MKTILRPILLLIAFVLAGHSYGQDTERDQIAQAILTGNAKGVCSFFINSVDLTILSLEDVYSREQAEVILARFFSDHKPSAFEIRHQGKSKIDDYFYIGDLSTEKGRFRITFFMKNEGRSFRVKQFRIEAGE